MQPDEKDDERAMEAAYAAMMQALDSTIDQLAQKWRDIGACERIIDRCVSEYWAMVNQMIEREYNAASK